MLTQCLVLLVIISLFNYDDIKQNLINKYKYMTYRRVNLLFDNNIFIKGEITKSSINNTINEINKIKKTGNINFVIDSHGGDLISGYNLIIKMLEMQEKLLVIDCYAINAKSTAFTIFQYCDNRYVIPDSILFQHNVSIEFKGSFEDFEDFYETRFDLYRLITNMFNKNVSNKIKMKYQDFLEKIWNDWTIKGGENIVKNNLADEVVIIKDFDYILN